jgi:hypothetical protein
MVTLRSSGVRLEKERYDDENGQMVCVYIGSAMLEMVRSEYGTAFGWIE